MGLSAIVSLDVVNYSGQMGEDPEAMLRRLNRVLREVVRPAVRTAGGRIVKLMGDGALMEFNAAGAALNATTRILTGLIDDPVQLRAGVHVGDVKHEADDVFGEAVNIAARLQAAARPGTGLASRMAVDLAGGNAPANLKPEGALRLKGIARPVEALSIDPKGAIREEIFGQLARDQKIRFVTSPDGTRLAWTAVGQGPPIVKAPNWIQHLELDWKTINAGWMSGIAEKRRLIRFDQRGNGLSDRNPVEISFDRFIEDLSAVYDASGVDRAPMIAASQGVPIAIGFAARNPERVTGIIAIGGYAQGAFARDEPQHAELIAATDAMGRAGWNAEYPSIRDYFARILAPDASQGDQRIYAEIMRETIEPEAFGKFRNIVGYIDVSDLLAEVRCPVLILHAIGDRLQPIEQGRRLAAGISDARLVSLDTNNHVLPDYDPALAVALREIDAFLAEIEA